ncbi:MAG: ABC transporter ATP-binding protein [Candidatus Poribacteria bacterium]|nr:ABC transporter ATP-binding protein [Candidatus Poribacteria bacterium]
MQPFIESLPPEVDAKLQSAKPSEEQVLIQVSADFSDDQAYGEKWLVATKLRVLVVPADGAVEEIPLDAIQDVKTEELVGGGCLVVERKSGAPVYLHYSSSLIPKFAEVAQGIGQLSKGKPLELPTEMERTRCDKCGRLLPEKDSKCVACIKKWHTLIRIQSYVNPYRVQLTLVVVITVIGVLINLLPPLITERIIDDVLIPLSNFNLLVWLVAGLLGAYLFSWLSEIGHTALSCWLGFRAAEDIRAKLYRCLQFLPIRFYDKHKVGALISRMTNDADRLEDFIAFEVPYVISNALLLVGIFCLLLYKNWVLTLYVLLPVPPIVLGGIFMWNRLTRFWRLWSARWGRFSSHLNESITGIRLVKAFAQEDRESTVFDRHNDALRQVNVSGNRAWFVFYTITNFLMSFGAFFVWYFGGKQVLGQEFKLGELTAFISFLWMLYQPLRWFGDSYNFMLRAFAGAERIFEVMDAPSEPFDNPNARNIPKIDGRITFKDVMFGYDPGKPVLRDINLAVEPGEMIGLVGKSGVGKSTMVNLICRFYDVTHGTLQVDNEDVRNVRIEDLRSQIGIVLQEPFLFNRTIAENIRYGNPEASFDEVMRAAIAAEAHDFIVAKPDGYDTMVGERGNKLSGGEGQRIAIARAILHNPKILILDEATSSLDTATEKKIQAAISKLIEGRTTFAIAHRLSTLRNANRLVVLDEGKIEEIGTHAELMGRKGLFYNLVKTQKETSAVMAVGGGKEDPGSE